MPIVVPVPSKNKPLPHRPVPWDVEFLSLLAVFYQASERRLRRFEQLNCGLAEELDRLRRSERRAAA